MNRGKGPALGPVAAEVGHGLGATTTALTPASARIPAPRSVGAPGSTGTYAAPERKTPCIAATASIALGRNRPTRSPRPTPHRCEAGRQPVGGAGQFGVGQDPAAFVLDRRVVGPVERGVVEELAEVVSVHAHGGTS